jgi:hypothetical protein
MKELLRLVSMVGLGLTVVPAFLVFIGNISWNSHANLMLAGTLIWFASAPFWMTEKKQR